MWSDARSHTLTSPRAQVFRGDFNAPQVKDCVCVCARRVPYREKTVSDYTARDCPREYYIHIYIIIIILLSSLFNNAADRFFFP